MNAEFLAQHLSLGDFLNAVRGKLGAFDVVEHWKQGEFHHDLVLKPHDPQAAPPIVVVATNCNGGVKEVLFFDHTPERLALWHDRCPDNPEFSGEIPCKLDQARTVHWFDPCALLTEDARSEYRPEFRERQLGGGWQAKSCAPNRPDPGTPPN
jgi:hypothetical protein